MTMRCGISYNIHRNRDVRFWVSVQAFLHFLQQASISKVYIPVKISTSNLFSWCFIYIQEFEAKNGMKPNKKKSKWKAKKWENRKVKRKKTNSHFKYILVYQIKQTTAEVKHSMHTKTCLLYPHSHQRRQGWHPCHWQKNIPLWSEWTSGFWSSGCRTSDGNGLCSSGTLQSAMTSTVRMSRREKPSPDSV